MNVSTQEKFKACILVVLVTKNSLEFTLIKYRTTVDKTSNALPQEAQKAHKRVRYSDVYPSSESDGNDESEVYVGSWVGVIYGCQWYPGKNF